MYLNCTFIGWTYEIRERVLTAYRLEIRNTGPEITLSLTIAEDFTWSMSYRRAKVKTKVCTLLKDVPFKINTGKLLNSVKYL